MNLTGVCGKRTKIINGRRDLISWLSTKGGTETATCLEVRVHWENGWTINVHATRTRSYHGNAPHNSRVSDSTALHRGRAKMSNGRRDLMSWLYTEKRTVTAMCPNIRVHWRHG